MDIYKTIVVCRKLPLKIESTFAYGSFAFFLLPKILSNYSTFSPDDYILVGTQEGHLLMYKLDIRSKTPSGKGVIF